jgi:hypothetical protein
LVKGKLPPIIPHKAEDKQKITKIFNDVERESK